MRRRSRRGLRWQRSRLLRLVQSGASPSGVTAASPGQVNTPAEPLAGATPAPAAPPAFAEKTETLSNSDVELRLTNRGGGISEARLLNHKGENGQGVVVLNSPDRLPIGAIMDQPAAPQLAEFSIARQPDGSVQFERVTPEGLAIRKRFLFPIATGKKDNYVAEMQVEFRNDGAAPFKSPGYFLGLGSTLPIHPKDMPTYTRAVWCSTARPGASM